MKKKSFLLAFPTIRTRQEFQFFRNLCEIVALSGYDLEVITQSNQNLPVLETLSPSTITVSEGNANAESLLGRLSRIPEKALIFNDLLFQRSQLKNLLVQQGVKTKIVERSPIANFLWVEEDIFWGESELFGFSNSRGIEVDLAENAGGQMLFDLSNNVSAFRRFEVASELRQTPWPRRLTSKEKGPKGYLLFLLDATKFTGWGNQNLGHPWKDLYLPFPNPSEALSIFSAFASAKGLDFVVKTHPSDPAPLFIPDIEAFEPSTGSIDTLLAGATAVVSGVSKSLWAAAALGKPFVSLGMNAIRGLIDDHPENADANMLIDRFAADLDRGYTLDMDTLEQGLKFANDTVWVRSDFNNTAASKLTEWVSTGQENVKVSEVSVNIWPEFSKQDRIVADESAMALEWVKYRHETERATLREPQPLVAVDVGAHVGKVTRRARALGYRVVAFEPNPEMAEKFQREHGKDDDVVFSRTALASGAEELRAFYTSTESTGISSLEAFHQSHIESSRVFTTSLKAFLPKWGIDHVDVLKIDTEGFDLFVLQGHDWELLKPSVVVCEFENAKTEPLGYRTEDLAQFLVARDYSVFVSEWFPIVRYGGDHRWRTIYPYGSKSLTDSSWGNLVAFHGEVSQSDVQLHFYSFLRSRPLTSNPKASPATSDSKASPATSDSKASTGSVFDKFITVLRVNMPTIYYFLKAIHQKARFRSNGSG